MSWMRQPAVRGSRSPIILAISLSAFTLWDYYFGPAAQGIRLFDLLSVGLILIHILTTLFFGSSTAAGSLGFRMPATRWTLLLAFISVFVVSGLIGYCRDPETLFRPTSGVFMGATVFLAYYCTDLSGPWIGRIVGGLILVHTLALLFQFVIYHSTGILMNYHQITGAEAHVFSSIFRPSGLFLEPGSYAVTTIMLLLLRWVIRPKFDWIAWIALTGVVISESFFGILALCSILAFFYWKRPRFWMLGCSVLLVALWSLPAMQTRPEFDFITHRLLNIDSDKSVGSRVGVITELDADTPQLWVGSGLGSDYHQFGLSGAGFLTAAVGIVGALFWLAIMAGLAPRERRIRVLFSLALVLVSAPIWTIMFWWAWLGLLCNQSLARREGNERRI